MSDIFQEPYPLHDLCLRGLNLTQEDKQAINFLIFETRYKTKIPSFFEFKNLIFKLEFNDLLKFQKMLKSVKNEIPFYSSLNELISFYKRGRSNRYSCNKDFSYLLLRYFEEFSLIKKSFSIKLFRRLKKKIK